MTDPRARAALIRTLALWLLWACLGQTGPAGLAAGAVTAALAAWASLSLLPPTRGLRLAALPGFAARFAREAVRAGADVARRAAARPADVAPGFLAVPVRSPEGLTRQAFCALASLQPGTLPVGQDGGGALIFHCLDRAAVTSDGIRADEARLLALTAGERPHG